MPASAARRGKLGRQPCTAQPWRPAGDVHCEGRSQGLGICYDADHTTLSSAHVQAHALDEPQGEHNSTASKLPPALEKDCES